MSVHPYIESLGWPMKGKRQDKKNQTPVISLTFDDIRILNQAQLLVVENKKIYLLLDGSSWP